MTTEQRQITIQQMLDRSGFKLGIAPLTTEHMDRVQKILQNRGSFTPQDTPMTKRQKTVKALLKGWALKNLKMDNDEWMTIHIENILLTDNTDIVFVEFKYKEDLSKFTAKAKNLPQGQGPDNPRLIMYVDSRAMKRHKAILNIAKTLREHSNNTIQTTVRTGKNDFLIRTRPKGSTTPWTDIPPLKITQRIPEFEIGTYEDIVEQMSRQDKQTDNMEQIEEVENIEQIVRRSQ